MSEKYAIKADGIVWMVMGRRVVSLLAEGRYATAAHVIKHVKNMGIVDSPQSWRTSVLLFQPIDLKSKPKPKRFAKSRFSGDSE